MLTILVRKKIIVIPAKLIILKINTFLLCRHYVFDPHFDINLKIISDANVPKMVACLISLIVLLI